MAKKIWRGDAPAVAQVTTLTPGGTIEVGDKFLMSINGKTLTYSATGTTVASVTAGITSAWNDLDATAYPEFAEITATDSTTHVTLTADTAGKPFTVTVSTTESDGSAADLQTFTASTTTASSGPNHWDTAANWSPSGVPASGDDVYISNSSVDILYGLDQSALTVGTLTIDASYTGKLGLPEWNDGGYYEYRTTYLTFGTAGAIVLTIGQGAGSGSGRLKINTGAQTTTLNVYGTGSPAEDGRHALLWKGSNGSNTVNVNRGSVGIAELPGETATISTLRVGYTTNQDSDADVLCGSGCTLATVQQSGGVLATNSAITTITKTGGTLTANGGNITTLNNDGGTVFWRHNGTMTTANIGGGGILDLSQDMRSRTITTVNLYEGARLFDPFATATYTNGFKCVRCTLDDVDVNIGHDKTYIPS